MSRKENLYPISPLVSSLIVILLSEVLLVPSITFRQVLKSFSSLEKASKMSISWYFQS